MAKTIYEKSVRALVRDMIHDIGLKPGQVITTTRVLSWFHERYPKLQPTGIRANLVAASTNDRSRLHHTVTIEDDLLFKVAAGQFRLYEPGKDPAPIHELFEGDVAAQELSGEEAELEAEELAGDVGFDGKAVAPQSGSEFILEKDLQNYLAKNLEVIEPGLKLYEGEDGPAVEFAAGNGRRIDILAVDSAGALVVIELKVSRGYDRVVGQLLRYVNWIKKNVAETGQKVRGIVVCRKVSEDLQLACAGIPDVELLEYQLSVTVSKVATAG